MQIVVEPLVRQKLKELLKALLDKDYFSFQDNAEKYVLQIYEVIMALPNLHFRTTKEPSFGRYYASYKANRRTTWYILFDKMDDRYIVRNLINNHTPDYPKFIASLK